MTTASSSVLDLTNECVDSELAALLDDELFQEEVAVTNADNGDRPRDTEEDEEQQQQPKRARREPSGAADTDPDFSGVDDDDEEEEEEDEDEEEEQQPVTGYICPPHPGWWMGLCIRCGLARRTDDAAQQGNNANNAAAPVTKIKHLHHKQALEVGVCWEQPLKGGRCSIVVMHTFCCSLGIRNMSTARYPGRNCDL